MTDIFDDIFDEGDALANVDSGTGKQLSDLVRSLRNVEQQIEDAADHDVCAGPDAKRPRDLVREKREVHVVTGTEPLREGRHRERIEVEDPPEAVVCDDQRRRFDESIGPLIL